MLANETGEALTIHAAFNFASVNTPVLPLVAAAVNYAPLGIGLASVLRLTAFPTGGTLGGLAPPVRGAELMIFNISTAAADTITLLHEDAGSTAAYRFRIPGGYNYQVPAHGMARVWYDLDSARWRVLAAAPALYAEGTWTPVLGGSTSETGQTYSTQSGRYVRIGSFVVAQMYLQFSNKGTIVGNLVVKGLPFATGGGSSYAAAAVGYMTNLAPTARTSVLAYIQAGQTYLNVLGVADYGVANPVVMTGADVNNTTQLILTVGYSVA